MSDRYIEAADLSHAWLEAVRLLASTGGGKAVHVLLRVADPTAEDEGLRQEAQALIDADNARTGKADMPDVLTTRNTIFPASWAARHPEPSALAEHYRGHYDREGIRGFKNNEKGTYFGRVVAYPRSEGVEVDQLSDTVRKLRDERRSRSTKSSRYEINIYNERKDTNPMSFPCLAHLSVHLHEGSLHMQAVYRNEVLVARAYGNYLGLAQLQDYVATAAGVTTGELLLTLGHVELEARSLTAARAMLLRHPVP